MFSTSAFIVLLFLIIIVCAFGYMVYRNNVRRAKEKNRNHFNDRV